MKSLAPLEPSRKKIYQEPSLRIYGSVEKITQSAGSGLAGDNPSGPRTNRKTGG
jgi:hypothetical protein